MTWKRARQKLHLILIRDAEKPVKRARISRFLLHAALVQSCLLIAAVVIWQYTLHQLSSEQISELSSRLSHTRSEYTEIVRSKESTIDNLQLEIVEMTRRTDDLRQQMEKLKKLEGEIRELLREVESPDLAAQSGTTAIASGADQSGRNVGGQAHPVTNEQWNQFLRETEDSFDRLHTEMQHLNRRLENARADLSAAVDALRRTPDHWPTDSNTVTSGYGIRKDPFTGNLTFHQGMDIGGKLNDPVYAAADGTVAARGWMRPEAIMCG